MIEAEEAITAAPPGKLISLLSVDDDANDILLLQVALKAAGFPGAIDFATDGQEAIEFLDRSGSAPTPDLVLLDLKMPRRNGFECLEWIRAHKKHRSLQVAIFTTSSNPADISKAYQLGADLFLVKPLAYDGLVSLVQVLGKALVEGDSAFSHLKKTPAFRPRP